MPGDTASDLARVAYERASAVVGNQRARLSEIRTNSSILLAATALVASFLGTWSLEKGEGVFAALAIAAFALGVLCGIVPVWPVIHAADTGLRGFLARHVSPRVATLLTGTRLWRRGPGVDRILELRDGDPYAILARDLAVCAEENDRILRRRSTWIVACGCLLGVQVLLWIANAV